MYIIHEFTLNTAFISLPCKCHTGTNVWDEESQMQERSKPVKQHATQQSKLPYLNIIAFDSDAFFQSTYIGNVKR